jgi:hypothetical protein
MWILLNYFFGRNKRFGMFTLGANENGSQRNATDCKIGVAGYKKGVFDTQDGAGGRYFGRNARDSMKTALMRRPIGRNCRGDNLQLNDGRELKFCKAVPQAG